MIRAIVTHKHKIICKQLKLAEKLTLDRINSKHNYTYLSCKTPVTYGRKAEAEKKPSFFEKYPATCQQNLKHSNIPCIAKLNNSYFRIINMEKGF